MDTKIETTAGPSQSLGGLAKSALGGGMSAHDLDRMLAAALVEDQGGGDLTSLSTVPEGTQCRAKLTAKAGGVLAGMDIFQRVFELCSSKIEFECLIQDGERVVPGSVVAELRGDARAVLLAERTALNYLQRMSGIATLTAEYVRLAAGRARILDTRKTTPGLRALEKYAVRCGGGENHRIGLFDEVMIKDNHLDLSGKSLGELVRNAREDVGPAVRITAEARDAGEAEQAAGAGADVILLDNLDADAMRDVGPRLRQLAQAEGRELELEASGGIDARNLAAVAASGVDRISIGALTHSAPALDLSLAVEAVR